MLINKDDSVILLIDVQQKLIPTILDSEALIQRCEWILRLAHKLNVPVLASEQYPQGLGPLLEAFKPYYNAQECIEKIYFSCMHESAFTNHLKELGKKQALLIGIEAHVCVLQTALEMKEAGFEVFVVVDAVSSRHAIDLKFALKRMKHVGIHLVTAEMVFFEWLRIAGTFEFKALSKEFLR